jgi:uncharacterized protein (UPF0332 family)
MTDQQTLFIYRMNEAEETLADARAMLEAGISPRSIVNRTYYAMFYSILALFIHENVEHRTSKHSGIIALFDRHFVHTGRLDRDYSKMLHRAFDCRQEADYRELVTYTLDDARECLRLAEEFLLGIKKLIAAGEPS